MWTAKLSESSSHLQLQTIPSESDLGVKSETALSVESQWRPNVREVEEAVDWYATDCNSGINAYPSWFHADDETTVCSDSMHPAARTIDPDFDTPNTDEASCHQQYDVVDSYVDSLSAWLQQQNSATCSYSSPQTLSPEHHVYQQQQQEPVLTEWHKAEPVNQTVNLADEQPLKIPTQKRSQDSVTLTAEEQQHLSGSESCVPVLTYKGRRLRHIAPKPTSATATHSFIQPALQYHSLLPKTTLSVVLTRPSRSAENTTTTSTSSNCKKTAGSHK